MNIQERMSLLVICFLFRSADEAIADIVDIIGGSEGEISQFPYQVSLRLNNHFICGGIIIDNRHILTAAHCVCDVNYSNCPTPAKQLTIVAGSSTLNPIGKGGVQIQVQTIFVHEKYVSRIVFANDIAVLRLSKDLNFGKGIQAYPLAEETPREGTECIASGWGMTSIVGSVSNTLMHVNTSIIGHNSCALINNVFYKVLCIQRGGKKTYRGDSGGPLNCGGKIAGIVSAGYLLNIYPTFFTDIAKYKAWIDIQLKRDTSTSVRFNFLYFIYVQVATSVYSTVRRLLFVINIPFIIINNIIRRIFPWLF